MSLYGWGDHDFGSDLLEKLVEGEISQFITQSRLQGRWRGASDIYSPFMALESHLVYIVNVTFSVNHFKMANNGNRSSNPIPNAWNQIPILMMGMGCQAMLVAMMTTTKTWNLCLFCILVPSNLPRTCRAMDFFLQIWELLNWFYLFGYAGADVILFENPKYRKSVHHFISFY